MTLGVMISYLLTLEVALRRVSPGNRTMAPGMVWLMLVPCINDRWQFQIATEVEGGQHRLRFHEVYGAQPIPCGHYRVEMKAVALANSSHS
jgi:hypothetical protein